MGIFVAYMLGIYDYITPFELDADEGNNLIKALLLDRGFKFGSSIWSDQPPAFSYLLWWTMKIAGWSVTASRVVVILFSGIAVMVTYFSVCVAFNRVSPSPLAHVAAISGSLLLIFSARYMHYSAAVMIGLPAISLMMLGTLSLTTWLRTESPRYLLAAGLLMGASVSVKMFTAFLPVLFMAAIALLSWRRQAGRSFWHPVKLQALFWTAFTVALVVALLPLVLQWSFTDLVQPHRIARTTHHGTFDGSIRIRQFVQQDLALFILAALGVIRAAMTRNVSMLLWAIWLISGVGVLSTHTPVWSHHRILLTAPGAILAGYFLGEIAGVVVRRIPAKASRFAPLLPVVLAVGVIFLFHPDVLRTATRGTPWSYNQRDIAAQKVIDAYRPQIRFMVTARQMYAFRAMRPVPPDLAVTSIKRFGAGMLTAEQIIEDIRVYEPEMVVLCDRWPPKVRRAVRAAIIDTYALVYENRENRKTQIWVLKRNDATSAPMPVQ